MTSEVWAIVGVIVGAILGGSGQIVADSIRHRRDRQQRIQALRREAYSEFLRAISSVYARALGFTEEIQAETREALGKHGRRKARRRSRSLEIERLVESTILFKLVPTSQDMDLAVSKVRLAGPDNVSALADDLETFCWSNFSTLAKGADEGGVSEEFYIRVNAFIEEARECAGLL